VEDAAEVAAVVLETDGSIAVIKKASPDTTNSTLGVVHKP
jgi:uncharacterized membrane protein YcaP (DUF421 family)